MQMLKKNFKFIYFMFTGFFAIMLIRCQTKPSAEEIRYKENLAIAEKEMLKGRNSLMTQFTELQLFTAGFYEIQSNEECQAMIKNYADTIVKYAKIRNLAFMRVELIAKNDSIFTASVGDFKHYDFSKKSINGKPSYTTFEKKTVRAFFEYTTSDVRDIPAVTIDGKTYTRIFGIRLIGDKTPNNHIHKFYYYVYYP